MKKNFTLGFFLMALFTIISCDNDDDSNNSASFKVDGVTYRLPPMEGINRLQMLNALEIDGNIYNRNTLIITGLNGLSSAAVVTFDLFLKQGQSLAGDYQISTDQDEDNPTEMENILSTQDRACLGWTSLISTTNLNSQATVSGNAPTGMIKVISNGGNNYTIQYSGNFKKIDEVTNISVEMNLTGVVSNQ